MTVLLAAAGLAALSAVAVGQEAEAPAPRAPAMTARREANVITVNGTPTVLMWARGLNDSADLGRYRAVGLNTAYLLLPRASEEALARASALASAAEQRGLMVVLALAPAALRDEEGDELVVDPLSEAYAEAVGRFVRAVADGIGDHPGLIGWSIEAVPPEQVVWNDAGFQSYLQDWYASLGQLNGSWGAEFGGWEEISAAGARDIDSGRPFGLGRASLDYAYYREQAYADSLSVWAQAVRDVDPQGLLFASALPDYRSIISVRPEFDGLILSTYPSLTEPDWQTHNVHAVDIARRANQFAAVQTLEVDESTAGEAVVSWAAMALAHGATGVAFSRWRAVRDSEALRWAVAQVNEMVQTRGFPVEPMPRAAILYEPFAGGALRNGRGLYGYLDGFTPGEPTTLFWAGRNGSRFGQFDVLAVSSLAEADLSQYGVMIAPAAFHLPDNLQMKLNSWVVSGGGLSTDLGVGMYQADGVVTSIPPIMREVLGIRYLDISGQPAVRQEAGELDQPAVEYGGTWDPLDPQEWFPLAPGQEETVTDPQMTRFLQALEEYRTRTDVQQYLGENVLGPMALAGMMMNGLGRGFAIFTPGFLYNQRDASDPQFTEFHGRLLQTGSELAVGEPAGVWPGVAAGLSRDWALALASPSGAATAVVLYGGGNQVYEVPSGAMRAANLAEEDWVELLFPGEPAAVARPLPIYLRPQGEGMGAAVSVVQYDRERIELLLYGAGAVARVEGGAVQMVGGSQTSVEVEVRRGAYGVPRGSMHRVTAEWGPRLGRRWEREMMPNPETGSLVIPGTFVRARLVVEPAEGLAAAPGEELPEE